MIAAAQSTDAALLEVADISKTFVSGGRKVEALHDVTFSVRGGQVSGLIGPDAAGKTTLMRLITGLLIPDHGHINVLGLDATRDSLQVQANVGYMPQRFGLYEDLTI
ncbi:MAG TPA: ATP-binding cassette domain-containing protein, partial [Gammaproteobacteria bacterium]